MQEKDLVVKIKALEKKTGLFCSLVALEFDQEESIFCYRSDETFPVASLIKLPLALGIYSAKLKMDKEIKILETDYFPGSGVLRDMRLKSLTVFELLALLLSQSDNSAQNVLLRTWGESKFKGFIKSLGLKKTKFVPLGKKTFSLTTVSEIAALGEIIFTNKLLLEFLSRAPINLSASFIPKNKKYYHKIGRRPEAFSDFIIIEDKKRVFLIVSALFGSGKISEKILNNFNSLAYKYLCTQDLSIPKK
jgi:beta-lactamase class A